MDNLFEQAQQLLIQRWNEWVAKQNAGDYVDKEDALGAFCEDLGDKLVADVVTEGEDGGD